jgi:hypothetical protein
MTNTIDYRKVWLQSLDEGKTVWWEDPLGFDSGWWEINSIDYDNIDNIENAEISLIKEDSTDIPEVPTTELFPRKP